MLSIYSKPLFPNKERKNQYINILKELLIRVESEFVEFNLLHLLFLEKTLSARKNSGFFVTYIAGFFVFVSVTVACQLHNLPLSIASMTIFFKLMLLLQNKNRLLAQEFDKRELSRFTYFSLKR
jgi:hypothetical protein